MYTLSRRQKTKSRRNFLADSRDLEKVLLQIANIPDLGTQIEPLTVKVSSERKAELEKAIGHKIPDTRQIAIDQRPFIERGRTKQAFPHLSGDGAQAVSIFVRRIWESKNGREREWLCFALRRFYARAVELMKKLVEDKGKKLVEDQTRRKEHIEFSLDPKKHKHFTPAQMLYYMLDGDLYTEALNESVPPQTEFEKIISYLQQNLDRARYCKNPECKHDPKTAGPYFFRSPERRFYCSDRCASLATNRKKLDWWNEHGKGGKR